MYSKCWLIIKDDSKRTFEICGQVSNSNSFTNSAYGMQKAGMNVSCLTPPVNYKNASRENVKVHGYVIEEGLHKRLLDEYRQLKSGPQDEWPDDEPY